jgi:hypothetical protein
VARLPLQLLALELPGDLGARLVQRAPAQKRLGLGQAIGRQEPVLVRKLRLMPLGTHHEFAGHHPRALVDELEEGVLAVGAGLAPDDRAGRSERSLPSIATRLPFDSISSCCR